MQNPDNIDVIIVGAGSGGVACATELAKFGKNVVVIERGSFSGSKNMFGGAIFSNVVEQIYPGFKENAPIERIIKKHSYVLLDNDTSVTISYEDNKVKDNQNQAIVVQRAKFDRWCQEEAQKRGVFFAFDTVVRNLALDDTGKVVGVETDNEIYYANLVILADGVNSLLARQIGLRNNFKTSDVILSVKEVFEFENEEIINQRLGLNSDEGQLYELVGGAAKNMFGMGILYTNKTSVSVGLGVAIDDLVKHKKKPYELLDELKQYEPVKSIIKDAKPIEYSAHLIPEATVKNIPQLYSDGVMVIGDAAMLVNNLHFEGTNLAMMSGKYAAEVAYLAIERNDFSKNTLKEYENKIKQSFIYKDIKSYKNVMKTLNKNSDSFMGFYIEKANEFFKIFTEVDSVPKKQKYRNFILNTIFGRCICKLFKDIYNVVKMVFEAIF